jgi:hypothetical protein
MRVTAPAGVMRITASAYAMRITASAEGVGALLAGDLARSGSKPGASVDQTNLALSPHDRFALNRRQTERRPARLLRPAGRINSHREQAPSHKDCFAASAFAAQDVHNRFSSTLSQSSAGGSKALSNVRSTQPGQIPRHFLLRQH